MYWKGLSRNSKLVELLFVSLPIALLLLLINPIITYDGWQYISSGLSIFDGTMASNYFFLRQPLYPFFVGLCLWLYESLWVVVIAQLLLHVISLKYFLNTIFRIKTLNSIREKIWTQRVSYFLIWLFLGSYPSYILPQNLFSPLILLFLATDIKLRLLHTGLDVRAYRKLSHFRTLIVIFSYLLAIELLLIFVLYLAICNAIKRQRERDKPRELIQIFLVIVCLHLTLSYAEGQLTSNPVYNVENREDIFVRDSLLQNLFERIKKDPPYTQTVINAALANLDLVPTLGWDGITTFRYSEPGHPAKVFALNHVQQTREECNFFPKEGVLAVDKTYINGRFSECHKPVLQLPKPVKTLTYAIYLLLWPLIVLGYLLSIVAAGLGGYRVFPVLFVALYALIGAGISRYGSPVYPLIIIYSVMYAVKKIQLRGSLTP